MISACARSYERVNSSTSPSNRAISSADIPLSLASNGPPNAPDNTRPSAGLKPTHLAFLHSAKVRCAAEDRCSVVKVSCAIDARNERQLLLAGVLLAESKRFDGRMEARSRYVNNNLVVGWAWISEVLVDRRAAGGIRSMKPPAQTCPSDPIRSDPGAGRKSLCNRRH